MKKIFQITVSLVVLLLGTSCEDVVQVKLDEGSKLYVIDAFVNDQSGIQTIRVSTNDSYFSNRIAPPVENATVLLRDLTDAKDYYFNHTGSGAYSYAVDAASPIAKVDHQYQLLVTIDGDTYSSVTTQRRGAGIDSITVEPLDNGGFGGPLDTNLFVMNLWAKDKTDAATDYYWVRTARNDTMFTGSGDINISIDGTNGPVNVEGIDSTSFTPPITFLGFKLYRKNDKCAVQIHSISRETYYFFVQAQAQINNGGLFATTPENVKTNINTPSGARTKAVGWFNMATVATASTVVP